MEVKVGDRFKHTLTLPYKDNGVAGVHRIVELVEVVNIRGNNAEFALLETLEESGRPSWAGDRFYCKGKVAGGFSIAHIDSIKTFERIV